METYNEFSLGILEWCPEHTLAELRTREANVIPVTSRT